MADCPICYETFNKSTRKPVTCVYCQSSACRECVVRFIMGDNIDEPHCLFDNCRKVFTFEFLTGNLTQVFINTTYKRHREQILLSREKSLLPQTQPVLEEILRKERVQREINELTSQWIELRNEFNEKIRNKYVEMQLGEKVARRKFVRNCPAPDCKGFLSEQYKCGICENYTCKECNELKKGRDDPDHVCNDEAVASRKLIEQDCKPCPNCAYMTHFISGCDQMWCVNCHSSWSWRTGQLVVSRHIHNPHYYEWMRKQNGGVAPRNQGDIPCGGLPHLSRVMSQLGKLKFDNVTKSAAEEMHRKLNELMDNRWRFRGNLQNNEDLRIMYLRNRINDDDFKVYLQQREKKANKQRDLEQIHQMVIHTVSDAFQRIVNEATEKSQVQQIIREIHQLQEFANDALHKVSKRYKCSVRGYLIELSKAP